jgi:ubiquinone/menaquinone biosynthesis C-methylase UbiE
LESNKEWKAWGKADPLYGVASWSGHNKDGVTPWSNEEFYRLGEDWSDFYEAWSACGLETRGTVLEYGSGVGRITDRLANSFEKVIACDFSLDMIAYAKNHILKKNIEWLVTDGYLTQIPDGSIDAVFSCHVFQHLPSVQIQLECFQEVYRVLNKNGCFMIHLPIHQFPVVNKHFKKLSEALYRMFCCLSSIKAAIYRLMTSIIGKPYMHGVSCSMEKLHVNLMTIGFKRIRFIVIPVGKSGSLHSCVIGVK